MTSSRGEGGSFDDVDRLLRHSRLDQVDARKQLRVASGVTRCAVLLLRWQRSPRKQTTE